MQILTSRFGLLAIDAADILRFPKGLIGLEDCRQWVLLADCGSESLAWLQSTTRPEIALAVVSPRKFLPSYQLRVARNDLTPLRLSRSEDAEVLSIVSSNADEFTLNLKGPLVINLPHRLGRQVIAIGDAPLRLPLEATAKALRRSA
ncbi:MAG: flagellar assembly protein FliW [Pirellulales bacterium]|nr:flagellar assembly protein FliW [Pirellulales bacterium]